MQMRRLVSSMFMLMAGAVSADALPVAALEAKIRGMMDENMTVGMSVVVVKGDKVVYQQAFGYRDKDTREPLDVNDIFRIASISKSFSGMSVMQLVEAGKMSLDDDVNDILGMDIRNPRYPDIPVTIKMLLSHTSGMNDGGGYHDLSYVDKTKTDINLIREKAWLTYPVLQPSPQHHRTRDRKGLGREVRRVCPEPHPQADWRGQFRLQPRQA